MRKSVGFLFSDTSLCITSVILVECAGLERLLGRAMAVAAVPSSAEF